MTSPPAYAVVILHYNRPDLLGMAVKCVDQQTVRPITRVIVDNASTAPIPAFEGWTLLQLPRNGGYSYGMNRGLSTLLDPDWLLLLTHDAQLAPDCVAQLLAAASVLEGPLLLGPLLRLPGTDRLFSAGGYIRGAMWRAGHNLTPPSIPVREVSWVDGAVLMLNREMVRIATPLDENYFLYYEDIDLGLTARSRGGRVFLVRDAEASQQPGTTSPAIRTRNRLRLVRKHAPIGVFVLNILGLVIRALGWMIIGKPRIAAEMGRAILGSVFRREAR